MALIRQVLQHPTKNCWAYIEYSDENKYHHVILGNKEFNTKEEAIEWSKGFSLHSYEYKSLVSMPRRIRLDLNTPAELAIHNAMQEIEKLGADITLTEAILLLDKAKTLVSDYVDKDYK